MARVRNSSSPLLTLAAFVVAIAALHLAKEILLPLALAVLISFLLTPLANRLERWHFPRVVSVITVVTVTFALLGAVGWVFSRQLVDLGNKLPGWRNELVLKVKQIKPESGALDELTETMEEVDKAFSEKPKKRDKAGKAAEAEKGEGADPVSPDEADANASAAAEADPTELERRAGRSSWSSETLWSWAE